MADLNDVIREIQALESSSPIDQVRRNHLRDLFEYTGRNTICYYSGFLNHHDHPDTGINDKDMSGFMTTIHDLDKSKGLDLIVHTPGGEVSATEAIGDYLRDVFGKDIRIFVPQLAMSGGTMLSCIGKEIYMGKHSSIGPIDPHFGGTPAYGIVQEYEQAKKEIVRDPNTIPFWQFALAKYPPAFVGQCYKAIELSAEVAKKWLQDNGMFDNDTNTDKNTKITQIMSYLNNNEHTKLHERHINRREAQNIGLNIKPLEEESNLQKHILAIHHCYMLTFQNTSAVKIIENHNGSSVIMSEKAC